MSSAYRIKRFSHVTPAKRRRLLEEKLVPILDEPNEDAPEIQSYLKEGDWLLEYRDSSKPFYIYKVKSYRHHPHLHLYIKHFIEAENIYRLGRAYVSDDTHILLAKADHLEVLPPHVYDMCTRYQDKTITDPEEKIKQLIFLLGLNRNIINKTAKEFLSQVENGTITVSELKAMLNKQLPTSQAVRKTKITPSVELVDPSKITGAISKAALQTYMKHHDGQLPSVKDFQKLTKRFTTPGIRRRRSF